MYKVYRGNPETDGVLIGIYYDVRLAGIAMNNDAACHESGTVYHMIKENESKHESKADYSD